MEKGNGRFIARIWGGAWLLTAVALLGKLLGAVYRIPLTRALGSHGMGMYQSVFPMYALLVTLAGGGLTAAVSKSVAEGDGESVLESSLKLCLLFSVPLTVVVAFLSKVIAVAVGSPDSAWAFLMLLPGVPLSGLGAVLRGYFQGKGNLTPSAVGQLTEQTVKLAVGLALSFSLAAVSLTAAVAGCALGVTAGEGVSVLYYFLRCFHSEKKAGSKTAEKAGETLENIDKMFYGVETLSEFSSELVPDTAYGATTGASRPKISGKARKREKSNFRENAKKIIKVSVPITLGLLILPLCQVADSFTVVNLLTASGITGEYATSLYGLVTGPVSALINMPAVLGVGVCGILLPKVSALIKRKESIKAPVKKVLLLSAATGAVFCAGIILFAPLALRILYGKNLGAPLGTVSKLLRVASVAVLFISVMQVSSAVLQGGGKAHIPALNLFLAAVTKEILNLLLLPRIGIYGFVIATDVFYALAAILDFSALIVFVCKTEKKREKFADIKNGANAM